MLNFHTNEWQNGYTQAQVDYSRLKAKYPHADIIALTERLRRTPLSWILKSQDYQLGYESYLFEISAERQSMADYTTKPPVPQPHLLNINGYQLAKCLFESLTAEGLTYKEAHDYIVMNRREKTKDMTAVEKLEYAKFLNEVASVLDTLESSFDAKAEGYGELEEV